MKRYYFFTSLYAYFLFVDALTGSDETCKEISVYNYEYNKFYDLNQINDAQSDDYFAKLSVAFVESPDTKNTSRVYEFLLGGYSNTLFEIRRKDLLYEKRDFNGNRFADYRVPTDREFNVEFSISKCGVIQIVEIGSDFKLSFVDQLPVIAVKYVSFAGYQGAETKVKFGCAKVAKTEITDEQISTSSLSSNDVLCNVI